MLALHSRKGLPKYGPPCDDDDSEEATGFSSEEDNGEVGYSASRTDCRPDFSSNRKWDLCTYYCKATTGVYTLILCRYGR